MARKLSAYNIHVADYLRAHPQMPRTEAFRAAAATWRGHAVQANPDRKLPIGDAQLVKWVVLGVAAWLLLPRLLQVLAPPPPPAPVTPPWKSPLGL